jgi:hypothetical protein
MVKYIKINRLQWAGHLIRMKDELQKVYSYPGQKGRKGLEDKR